MFSKPERDTNSTKRRITPELIQPHASIIVDDSIVESTPAPVLVSVEKDKKEETSEGTGKECIICYESLSATKNMCITECGHEFCFTCMMKHAQRNNGCPICRAAIIEEISDSESDSS